MKNLELNVIDLTFKNSSLIIINDEYMVMGRVGYSDLREIVKKLPFVRKPTLKLNPTNSYKRETKCDLKSKITKLQLVTSDT